MNTHEVRELIKDVEHLPLIMKDDKLTDFLLNCRGFRDTGGKEFSPRMKGERYERRITDIIKHIEEWK